MKFHTLAIIAVGSIVALSSCKKEKPQYCTEDLFQDAIMTDAAGAVTTTFGQGATINLNMLFINTTSDTVKLTYSEPWITYEIWSGGQLVVSSSPQATNTGISGLSVAPADTVDAFFPLSATFGNLPIGTYQMKAKNTYQYKDCESGIQSIESTVDFTVQ